MSMTALLVLAGLWPLGRAPEAVPSVADVVVPARTAVVDPPAEDPRIAAEAYAAFLASPAAADAGMRLTAMRRLADLQLEAAEQALAEGGSPDRALEVAAGLYRALLEDPVALAEAVAWQDHWRYQLARALTMAGREADAEATLVSLVAERPDSALAPEAWFRIGEARFLARDWDAAERSYRASLGLEPAGPFAEQAYYKLGWTLFRQSRFRESFAPLAAVLDGRLSEAPLEELDPAGRELADDSLRAMSIGLASLEGAASLAEWFDSNEGADPAWAGLAFARLAEYYLEQERWTDAAGAYLAWVERAPLDLAAPEYAARAVDALLLAGFMTEALAGMASYAERFGTRAAWWDGREPSGHAEVRARLREFVDALAAHHHARFQQSGEGAADAAAWYRRSLDEFPHGDDAAERHFLLAELHHGAGELEAAAEAYRAVAFDYGAHGRAAEAGFAAVLVRRDLAALAADPESAELELVEAALAFSSTFSSDPRAAAVELEAAERLMALGRLEAAVDAAGHLLARGELETATRAAALLVSAHASFDLGEFAAAEVAYAQWLALPPDAESRPAERVGAMRERLAATIYRQGQQAAEAGELNLAVTHFERVRTAVPASPVAAIGQHDAAALLFADEAWERAAAAYRVFVERWPDHDLASDARVSLAAALVEAGDVTRAAPALVEVSRLPGQPEELRRSALWQAADFYQASGDGMRMERALQDYLERFPEPGDAAMEARHRLAEAARARGDDGERRLWLERIVAQHEAEGEAGTARGRTLAAAAALELAMPAVERFEVLRLEPPLDRSVPEKARRMRAALEALGAAAGHGVAEVTTEASFRMAELYRGMATALLGSARPAGLDEAAMEQYELLLEEQAFPFEEDAISIHEANAARTRDGLYDRWILASFEALAELVPARWNRQEAGENVVELRR